MVQKKSLFQITWPIYLELMLFMLMGAMDTFMLSGYNDLAVAAVGLSNQITFLVGVLLNIVGAGVITVLTQYIGAKRIDESKEVAFTGILVNLGFGILLATIMLIFSTNILHLMNTPKEIFSLSESYLNIVVISLIFTAVTNASGATLRGYGYTKTTMILSIIANFINIGGNFVLIYGIGPFPELGSTGAAISTTISRFILMLMALFIIHRRVAFVVTKDYFNRFKGYFLSIVKIGLPSAGEQFSYSLSQAVIVSYVTTLGTLALTTRVYVGTIVNFVFLLSAALAQGNQILIGYLVGNKEYDKAYKQTFMVNFRAMAVTLIFSISVALLGEQLLSLLTDNQDIIKIGKIILWVDVFVEQGRVINLIVIAALRASGDVNFPVVMAVFSMWGVATLGAILSVQFGFGLVGVWFFLGLDEWVRGISMLFRWKSKRWVDKVMVHREA